jgi:flagellar export protein FliJ
MFRFRLQRVLDLRERRERDAATAVTRARDAAALARRDAAALAAARAELAAADAGAAGAAMPVGALHNLAFLLGRMDEQVAHAGEAAEAAEAAVGAQEGLLREASRDRRTMGRLRERHEGVWRADAAAADRRQMDELALARYAQGPAAPSA